MTLPSPATKVHLDSAADDPQQARAELASLVDGFNALLTHMALSAILADPLGIGGGLEDGGSSLQVAFKVSTKSGAYTVVTGDRGKLIKATAGTWTLALPAAATAGDGFFFIFRNDGAGVVTIDPNGSQTIDGATTKAVSQGSAMLVLCDGTEWATIGQGDVALSLANVFTNDQWIRKATPVLNLDDPTNTNALKGYLSFWARDAGAALLEIARVRAEKLSDTDGAIRLLSLVTSAFSTELLAWGGLVVGAAAGGHPGIGGVNAEDYELDGVALPIMRVDVSGDLSFSPGAPTSFGHSLGVVPDLIEVRLKNVTPEHGWLAGDELRIAHAGTYDAPMAVWANTTFVNVRPSTTSLTIAHRNTGAPVTLTPANWVMVIRAFA